MGVASPGTAVQGNPGGDSRIGFESSWYYSTAAILADRAALRGAVDCDVCVIGAGYTGLVAALSLASRGYSVRVLERYRVASGASGRNGGVLGPGQRLDQETLEHWLGDDHAADLWRLSLDANDLVRELVSTHGIDCDLTDGHLLVAHKARLEAGLWREAEHLRARYNYEDVTPVRREQVQALLGTDRFFGGNLDRRGGHLHPLNYALGLARAAEQAGAVIHERTEALELGRTPSGVRVRTAAGLVSAKFVVLACNGYLGRLESRIGDFMMPINNFILATEPLGETRGKAINRENLAVVDTRFVVSYFHNSPDHRLIFGGGENYTSRFPTQLESLVRARMLDVYPMLSDVRIEYVWGGTLAITLKRMPQFGRLDDVIYFAHGYSGHGIAMATLGGRMLAEAIGGQAERFDVMARIPQWRFPGGRYLRWPGLVAGMLWYSLLDRL
ncbi:MAG: FAD-binding oxidoreductase [Gammaproteobacteria bacterium]|nr:FAD-binding oxidoreductase [Gammaproteobacteria bacterium]